MAEEERPKSFNVDEELAQHKIERWGSNDNFVAPRELTVTITLNEYRQLIGDNTRYNSAASSFRELAEERLKEIQRRDARIADLEANVRQLNKELKPYKPVI